MTSGSALVDVARKVADLAAPLAGAADALGELDPAVVDATVAAGFPRHFVSARWGGSGGSFAEVTEAVALVSAACPATGWLASLTATLGRLAGYLPTSGQQELWEDGPDPVIVGSLLPLGTARPGAGGWTVQGFWPYVSWVEFSAWALVLARTPPDSGGQLRFFAVPRTAYRIERSWSTLGMRATASHTLVLPDTAIPADRSFSRTALDTGAPAEPDVRGAGVPLEAVAGLAFAPTVVGAARGALDCWTAWARSAERPGGRRSAEEGRVSSHLVLARAAGEIGAAELLLDRVAGAADRGRVGSLQAAENARDCALAAELATTAVDRLVRSAGTTALAQDHPLSRLWRDATTAGSHIMLSFPRAAAGYARQVL